MRKLLLSVCTLLIAGIASAQCNPTFTYSASPSGNSLLRVAITNTTTHTWTGNQYAAFSYVPNAVGATYTGSTNAGATGYLTFTAPGTYSVGIGMVLRDSTGSSSNFVCSDTAFQTVTVGYAPCGTRLNYSIGAAGSYSFTANNPAGTSGMIYTWNFGDGTSGTGASITHTYTANGVYTVSLTASNGSCTYANSTSVVVSSVPINCANNHAAFNTSVSNNVVTFNNTTPSAPFSAFVSYFWDFGDGIVMNYDNPTFTHTYAATGTYNVTMISTWRDSTSSTVCSDTAHGNVTISNIPAPPNQIGGYVSRNDTNASNLRDSIRVWLIRYDSTAQTLTAMDSTWADSAFAYASSYYNSFHFYNVTAGSYLVKAARIGGTVGMNGPIPTYSDSSYYWNTAMPVTVSGGTSGNINIDMRHGIISSGPGFIGGNVSLGANRGTGAGLAGMTVLLRNNVSGKVLRSTTTDLNGDFSFSSIPTGLYSIYPEEAGYATTAFSSIAITNAQNAVTGLNFKESRRDKTITPIPAGITILNGNGATVNLYPNPAKGAVTLSWKGFDGKAFNVSIVNITGQLVHTQSIGGAVSGASSIDIAHLQPGIYSIRIHSNVGETVQKLVVQP